MRIRKILVFTLLLKINLSTELVKDKGPLNCAFLEATSFEDMLKEKSLNSTEIGHGGFGKVFDLTNSSPRMVYKQFDLTKLDTPTQIISEINMLRDLEKWKQRDQELAKNLVSLPQEDSCYFDKNNVYIIMKKYALGDLFEFLNDPDNKIRNHPLWVISASHLILGALVNFHRLDYIHADIKPENYFMDSPYEVFLGDFTLALNAYELRKNKKFIENKEVDDYYKEIQLNAKFGTPFYMAPESNRGRISKSSDIYSLGLLIHEMFMGLSSNNGSIRSRIYYECDPGMDNYSDLLSLKSIYCKYYNDLVKNMTMNSHTKRLSSVKLLANMETITSNVLELYKKFIDQVKIEIKTNETELNKISGNNDNNSAKTIKTPKDVDTLEAQIEKNKQIIDTYSIETFLRDMYRTIMNNRDKDDTYKKTVIKDFLLFFDVLDDQGASILGCNVYKYLSNNCERVILDKKNESLRYREVLKIPDSDVISREKSFNERYLLI